MEVARLWNVKKTHFYFKRTMIAHKTVHWYPWYFVLVLCYTIFTSLVTKEVRICYIVTYSFLFVHNVMHQSTFVTIIFFLLYKYDPPHQKCQVGVQKWKLMAGWVAFYMQMKSLKNMKCWLLSNKRAVPWEGPMLIAVNFSIISSY